MDAVALGILSLAAMRGLFIGMIREAFSIAALGGAVIGVRVATAPLSAWLRHEAGVGWGDFTLRVVAAAIVVVGVVGAVVIAGRVLRRGVRAAGLGWADRLGGGLLGGAEGLLVVALLLAGAVALVGREHAALAESRTLAALDEARRVALGEGGPGIDVAAPPPARRSP